MSNYELTQLSKRVDEISEILDLCHDVIDADVIENLDLELSEIYLKIEGEK